ncbi:probable aminoacyl tRNA synthase complex-interacting multifunctional protein 2 [Culicoides brevitarsis]|uniref:probable aminoacyl tRNA synthase complex-interacting multifunctional protein 2 n=1 Tax=Culicoides brevitarsis TaxID=469753 RepID=UPI00307BE903
MNGAIYFFITAHVVSIYNFLKMYKLKKINEIWPNIDLPDCMYNMKAVVNLKLEEQAEYPNINISLNQMDVLSARQEKLLIQLEKFKNQLQEIRSGLNVCAKPVQASHVQLVQQQFNVDDQSDLIVNANHKFIPYCLLALKKLWINHLLLHIKFHTHSSVAKLDENAQKFMMQVQSIETSLDVPTLGITVIWHAEVGRNTELIAPASYAPLHGEVTLLRWLTRIGPPEFTYENSVIDSIEVDSLLDICFLLINNSTDTKERLKYLRILNTRLGKQKYFGGQSISIADVAVSSTVKQGFLNDLTPALNSWLKHVSTYLGY